MELAVKKRVMDKKIIWLIIGLVVMLVGSVLFVRALGGGDGGEEDDDSKIVIDTDYECGESCEGTFIDIDAIGYENLLLNQKSFIVLVDQEACVTGDRLKGFFGDYLVNSNIKVYRIMFEDMKQTSLYDKVNYYPSVAIISKGSVVAWLDAESDEDKNKYDEYDAFRDWMNENLNRK